MDRRSLRGSLHLLPKRVKLADLDGSTSTAAGFTSCCTPMMKMRMGRPMSRASRNSSSGQGSRCGFSSSSSGTCPYRRAKHSHVRGGITHLAPRRSRSRCRPAGPRLFDRHRMQPLPADGVHQRGAVLPLDPRRCSRPSRLGTAVVGTVCRRSSQIPRPRLVPSRRAPDATARSEQNRRHNANAVKTRPERPQQRTSEDRHSFS